MRVAGEELLRLPFGRFLHGGVRADGCPPGERIRAGQSFRIRSPYKRSSGDGRDGPIFFPTGSVGGTVPIRKGRVIPSEEPGGRLLPVSRSTREKRIPGGAGQARWGKRGRGRPSKRVQRGS